MASQLVRVTNPGTAARRRRPSAQWLRTLLARLRQMWTHTRRHLATTLAPQRLTAVLGVACLALDCVAVGSVLLA